MRIMYYNRYIRLKNRYKNLKMRIMIGGAIDDPNVCLTSDSRKLMDQLKPIINEYSSLLDRIVESPNRDVVELINRIKKCTKKEDIKYDAVRIDNSITKMVNRINIEDYIEAEDKGSRMVLNYLKHNKIDKPFAFMGSDVAEDLKMRTPRELYKIKLNDTKLILPIVTDNLVNEIEMHKRIVDEVGKYFDLSFTEPNILLLLSDAKKYFPTENRFTARSINSAEFSPRDNQLTIFRKEELSKLLFHELVHRANIEHHIRNYQNQVDKWTTKWAINRTDNNVVLFNESLVESFAQFINLIVTSKMCDLDFDKLWRTEIGFGLYQSAKILYLSGFTNNKEFVTSSTDKRINESTSVAEYHIFKTIIMLNFNKFISLYKEGRITNILDMVYDFSLNNDDYNKIIDGMIKSFQKDDSHLFRTGRMSIVERDIIL